MIGLIITVSLLLTLSCAFHALPRGPLRPTHICSVADPGENLYDKAIQWLLSLKGGRRGAGQGNAGGWPSTTGNPSGGGRSNAPPRDTNGGSKG